jgi:hypothetical protein
MDWDDCEVGTFVDELNMMAWNFMMGVSVIVVTTVYLSVSSLK